MKLKLDEKKIRKGKAIGLPYQGSKKKISKKLIEIIKQNFGTDKTIYDLFGGGGAISFECIINGLNVIYNDIDPIPGQMIEKILSEDREYLKSLMISREEFFEIREKEEKTVDDSLKLLINSFGNNCIDYLYSKKNSDIKYKLAKEIIEKHDCFYGYKQTETFKKFVKDIEKLKSVDWDKTKEKHIGLEAFQRLEQFERICHIQQLQGLRQLENLQVIKQNKIKFYSKDYKDFSDVKDSIIYLDPPYENTRRIYKYSELNYDEFYSWCKTMSKDNIVLISGYNMPDDFEVVYEFKKAKSTLQSGTHANKYEKLFMVRKEGEYI